MENMPKTDTVSIFNAASLTKKKSFKTWIHSANNKFLLIIYDAVAKSAEYLSLVFFLF
jgi:hypothetical protein